MKSEDYVFGIGGRGTSVFDVGSQIQRSTEQATGSSKTNLLVTGRNSYSTNPRRPKHMTCSGNVLHKVPFLIQYEINLLN